MCQKIIMNQLHVNCDINDIVSGYLIGVKINPYKSYSYKFITSYRWHEVSKVARNRNGTKSKWHEVSDIPLNYISSHLKLHMLGEVISTVGPNHIDCCDS